MLKTTADGARQLVKINLPYVTIHHGKYAYFRWKGKLHPLPNIDSPEFSSRYQEILRQFQTTGTHVKSALGSMSALIEDYRRTSPEYKKLAKSTREGRERYFNIIHEKYGKPMAAKLTTPVVYSIRDSFAETPGIANNLIATMSALMEHAIRRGLTATNPCKGVKRLEIGEIKAWPRGVLELAINKATPFERVVIYLHLYTGQRISDVVKMTHADVRNGKIRVAQQKTGKTLWLPLHHRLRAALEAHRSEGIYLIENRYHAPFTTDGLRNRIRKLLNRIDHIGYSPHGLRKNAVIFLLELGCTVPMVASITGQSFEMVEYYARQINQEKMAGQAMDIWEKAEPGTKV